ncbi:MAG: superoxide dismutase, Ni [Dehalococcoidia bacterium]
MKALLRLIDRISPPETVHAHCDIPCGIYDPHLAQIGALTCIRMNQLINDLGDSPGPGDKKKNDAWHSSLGRYITVKEEHAELVKREVRIIWGDFFKPEHLEKSPDLHATVWNIMKGGSKVRQNIDLAAAEELLAGVQKFAEAFWAAKGVKTQRVPSQQAVGGELVVPA